MGSSFLLILIALSGRLWQYQGIKELAQTAGQMFQFKVTPVIHSCPHFAAELFTFEMNVKCLSTSHAWGGGKPARNENSNRKLPAQLYNTPNNNWVICIRYGPSMHKLSKLALSIKYPNQCLDSLSDTAWSMVTVRA